MKKKKKKKRGKGGRVKYETLLEKHHNKLKQPSADAIRKMRMQAVLLFIIIIIIDF